MTKQRGTASLLGYRMLAPSEIVKRNVTLWTHRIHTLPVVVLMPHSRCNCRCVMCDIWKANDRKQELSRDDLAPHLEAFGALGVRSVVLSGGEPLMHSNLWTLCELLEEQGVRITLLSTGLSLERHAQQVVQWCNEVIVSLDGPQPVHDRIRRVPRAFDRLAAGVNAIRRVDPQYRVTGRCVVQRLNYEHLPGTIEAAHDIPLNQISFLAADLTTEAFNRPLRWDEARASEVGLEPEEAREFERILEEVIVSAGADLESGFIAEPADKLRRIAGHFLALNGQCEHAPPTCNAPWVSTVIEADGTVRPCFFHSPLGNIHETPLDQILNADRAIEFRRNLDVATDEICRRCVCTLHLSSWRAGGL